MTAPRRKAEPGEGFVRFAESLERAGDATMGRLDRAGRRAWRNLMNKKPADAGDEKGV